MRSPRNAGRIVGLLLLLHLATGLTVPYIMLQRITASTFLTGAAAISSRFRLAVLLLFVGGAIPVAIVITAWPTFRQYSYAMALWLLALALVNLSLQAVENAHWMSMLSLSQEYVTADAANAGLFEALGRVVRSAWKWAHYTHLLVVVSWMFMLCALLFRSALVPRVMAALGMVGTLLQLTGITLPQFVGYSVKLPILFGLPLGVIYLTLSVWLMAKGFADGNRPVPAETDSVEVAAA